MMRFLVEIDDIEFMPMGLGEDDLRNILLDGWGFPEKVEKHPGLLKARRLTEDEFAPTRRDTEKRMILKNQQTIMEALLMLSLNGSTSQLYYDIAKTQAYLGNKEAS